MAAGDVITIENPVVSWAGTDISGYCAQARIMLNHVESVVPHLYGQQGAQRVVSTHYDWSVTFDFVHDGFGTGTLEKAITDTMPPPLGPANGPGRAALEIAVATGTQTDSNPKWQGTVVVSSWEPLGSGQAGQIMRQSRTFNGDGALTKVTS